MGIAKNGLTVTADSNSIPDSCHQSRKGPRKDVYPLCVMISTEYYSSNKCRVVSRKSPSSLCPQQLPIIYVEWNGCRSQRRKTTYVDLTNSEWQCTRLCIISTHSTMERATTINKQTKVVLSKYMARLGADQSQCRR